MPVTEPSARLKKQLSLFDVYAIATGATLSSGLFLLPGLAAAQAGPAVVLSYLLAVVPFVPGILSKIELATAMPRAGGVYYFLDRSLGPLAGTVGGIGTWCALMLKTSFALIGIGAYLGLYFPKLPMAPVAAGLAVFFGAINLLGARKSGTVQATLVICLLLLLIWFTGKGVGSVEAAHFTGFFDKGWHSIFAAAGLVGVSYMGITKVASVAEEVKNPERNLPLGILLALLTAVAVYGLGTLVIVGVLDPAQTHKSQGDGALLMSLTPVADAASSFAGSTGAIVMTVAAVLAFLSVANAGVLSASRYPLAMGRDKLVPEFFNTLNRHNAPSMGIVVTVAVIIVLVTAVDATNIAKLASAFQLMLFALNCLAVIVMRESKIESYDPGFRCIWYPWLQIFGIIAPIAFIVVMGWEPVMFSLGLVSAGTLWYVYYARHRVVRSGAIYHLFARLGRLRFEGLDSELRGIMKEKGLRQNDPFIEIVASAVVVDCEPGLEFDDVVRRAADALAVRVSATAEELVDGFVEGTRIGLTPVSGGIALPHMRLPDIDEPHIVLARSRTGVSVATASTGGEMRLSEPNYAVFFLLSPKEDPGKHLRLLAELASRVDQHGFLDAWKAAETDEQLKSVLLRHERYMPLVLQTDSTSRAFIDRHVHELDLPDGCLLAVVHRGRETIIPRGRTRLVEGDRLSIIGDEQAIALLYARFADAR